MAVGGLALIVRWYGAGSFMTVDEENWMLRSAGFYHKLFRNGDTGGAFMTTHPGATLMWLSGAGIVWQEARLGFDVDTSNIAAFRRAAVWPVLVAISLLIGFTAWQAMRVFGVWPGAIGGALLALEPYGIGMSQIAHLDALLALFMLNSVLAFFRTRAVSAGVFAGLAMATKLMPSVWLFLFFGVVLLFRRSSFSQIVRTLGFIFGVAALTFYAVWPALWFTADLGRSFGKDVPSVVTDAHVELEQSQEATSPASFYVRTLLGRTTPFVLILSVGVAVAAVSFTISQRKVLPAAWLLLYGIGFLVLISAAAKKADRYALPALVALPIVAGWFLGRAAEVQESKRQIVIWLASGAIFVLLLGQAWMWVPHTIAYNSPFFDVRPLSQQGWGEGLEQAAAWLNAQPRAEETFVASWYPSVLAVFFKGKTLSLSSREDDRVGFVVSYRNMMGRGPDDIATHVLREFAVKTPVHTVEIRGVPYAWVYDVRGLHYFPQHVGEVFGTKTVGQLVPVAAHNWDAVEIGLATFSGRNNTQDVLLHIREGLESQADVRVVRVNAREIEDSSYHRFEFPSIPDSAGKTYYVFLESPTSQPGDAITVRFANDDIVAGEMVRDGAVTPGRDVAYRLGFER